MGSNPSFFSSCGDNCPVEQVSWYDAQAFVVEMNKRGDGKYRLPTEAEWEYAAWAGTTTAFANGGITNPSYSCDPVEPNLNAIGWYAWYCVNAAYGTHPVGQKIPNAWGLYDMHGNVNEWVQDWSNSLVPYPSGGVTDPQGPSSPDSSNRKKMRGGSWRIVAQYCRSASRIDYSPDVRQDDGGFRLVREQ